MFLVNSMNLKCWILFILCMLCGLTEIIITTLKGNYDILSVVVCSLGILFFILFLIAVQQYRKESDK